MIKIEVESLNQQTTLRVEGDLTRHFVAELERCWHEVGKAATESIVVNVNGVIRVDGCGRILLQSMYRHGIRFTGVRLAMQDVLDEIAAIDAAKDRR